MSGSSLARFSPALYSRLAKLMLAKLSSNFFFLFLFYRTLQDMTNDADKDVVFYAKEALGVF
jgi:hypothetical protein